MALRRCAVQNNLAGDAGGGIYGERCQVEMEDCTVERNATAGNIDWPEGGGGLFCYYSDLVLEDCTISDNSAGGNWSRGTGGGLEFAEDSTSATIINCTIADNLAEARGGGIYNWGDSLTAISCILWNNLPDQIFDYANPLSITHSDIQNGWPGEGNIDGDPRFVDPEGNDYHLGKKGRCGGGGDWGATTCPGDPSRHPRPGGLSSTTTSAISWPSIPSRSRPSRFVCSSSSWFWRTIGAG
ncbi:MAG: hypothetical protein CME06_09405 [Gemmatimonadetes bacterium]|nr:hypothetical protein [Gemmatimonadota bacterium]